MTTMASSLNMTLGLNLSSIFTFPSKLVSRMRKVDEDWFAAIRLHSQPNASPTPSPPQPSSSKEESPLATFGFFTSKYVIGLILMAAILHRIHNIILPSVNRPRNRPLLDLSSTATRLALHIPTVCLLIRALALWSITLLQTCYLLPSPTPVWAAWVTNMSFGSICWWTFLSICASFALDSLIRVLSINSSSGDNPGLLILENFMLQAGGGGALPGHPGGGGAPFNLVGYAFLLHVYSNPLTHLFSPEDSQGPTRPDMHTVMTISIPLIQVTMLHIMQIYKPWSNYRLIPTAISSILSLLHFHGTLWAWPVSWSPMRPYPPPPPNQMNHNPNTGFPQYPLLNYIPSALETGLLLLILLTLFLNAVAQCVVSGRIHNLGLGLGLGRIEAVITEDFPVLLLRLGTATLEHSGSQSIRGWSNEGPEIAAAHNTDEPEPSEYGTVRMARDGRTMVLSRGATSTSSSSSARRKRPKLHRGWRNEIRSVSLLEGSGNGSGWSWLKSLVGNWTVFKEAYVFFRRGVFGLCKRLWQRYRSSRRHLIPEENLARGLRFQKHYESQPSSKESGEELYERFRRGEVVSDDDDSDWVESTPSHSDGEESQEDCDDNPMTLMRDLRSPSPSSRHSTPEPHQRTVPILMAHMTTPSGKGALTRRRYRSLLLSSPSSSTAPPQNDPSFSFPRGHRGRPVPLPSSPSQCVVCISSPREIICWPCRCLTVCDECRDSLASGAASGSASRCPCCRRVVEGYSRIYMP